VKRAAAAAAGTFGLLLMLRLPDGFRQAAVWFALSVAVLGCLALAAVVLGWLSLRYRPAGQPVVRETANRTLAVTQPMDLGQPDRCLCGQPAVTEVSGWPVCVACLCRFMSGQPANTGQEDMSGFEKEFR
jgi:hypothetical protein